MKNIFKYLAVLASTSLMVASCAFEEEVAPDAVVPAPEISVSVDNLKDNSFTVNVAPDGEALYYSVLIVPEGAVGKVDSVELYRLKYESKILAKSISYVDHPNSTFEIKDLTPNATYEIHAVAGGKTGQVGKLTSKKVTTPDAGAPKLVEAEFDKKTSSFVLTYSEPVKLGKGKFTLDSYAVLNFRALGDTQPSISEQVPAANIKAAGETVTISLDKLSHPGALIALSYDGTAVEDIVGNKSAAVASKFVPFKGEEPSPNDGKPVKKGICSQLPFAEWDILGFAKEKYNDAEMQKPILLSFFKEGEKVGSLTSMAVTAEGGNALKADLKFINKSSETLLKGVDVPVVDLFSAAVVFGEQTPDPDDKIVVNIAAEQLVDLWGNPNAAFEGSFVYESALTPFYGEWNVNGLDAFMGADPIDWKLELAPSKTKGKLDVKNMFAVFPMYAEQIPGFEPIYQMEPVFTEGKISGFSMALGTENGYAALGMNFYLMYLDVQLVDPGDGKPVPTPVPVPCDGKKITFELQKDGSLVLGKLEAPLLGVFSPEFGGALDAVVSMTMKKAAAK